MHATVRAGGCGSASAAADGTATAPVRATAVARAWCRSQPSTAIRCGGRSAVEPRDGAAVQAECAAPGIDSGACGGELVSPWRRTLRPRRHAGHPTLHARQRSWLTGGCSGCRAVTDSHQAGVVSSGGGGAAASTGDDVPQPLRCAAAGRASLGQRYSCCLGDYLYIG